MVEAILILIATAIIFVLMLSILVFVHEAGHFFVAKWSGIKVEEFGFGLPPRAWGKKVGETIYSLNWLPFGGFVKLYGEDEAGAGKIVSTTKVEAVSESAADQDRAFYAKPLFNRIAVVVAGVFMNLLLAIVLYYGLLISNNFSAQLVIPIAMEHTFIGATQTKQAALVIDSTSDSGPAKAAGLKKGDRIVEADGAIISSIDQFKELVDTKRGQEITVKVLDLKDKASVLTLTPRLNPPEREGPLGIVFGGELQTYLLQYKTVPQKLFSGFFHAYNVTVYSFELFGKIIGQAFTTHDTTVVREGVAGPVGILGFLRDIVASMTATGVGKTISVLVEFTAMLSLNLAVVNILPFPALDGGRLFFLIVEGITRRKVNQQFEQVVNQVGMAILLGLILLITFNDVTKFFR